ncbi:MAG: tetratricopeptide repeat protein [Treponema sp.]|jgi:tetratricopeptide (TPR) repeat protein|nr:tetratricopeptide repeat protein [Treponema sp.]
MKTKNAILFGFIWVLVIFTAGCTTYLMDKMAVGAITETEALQLIDIFDRQIQRHPDDWRAYNNRAITFMMIKKYQEAINDYSKVIELNPDNAVFFLSRGSLYIVTREYDRAIEDLNTAIKLNVNDIDSYYERGVAKHLLRQYHEALEDYDYFLEHEPKSTKVMAFKAIALDRLEQYQEAIDILKKAIEIDNQNESLYYMVGQLLFLRLQNYLEAFNYFDHAIKINNRYSDGYEGRGLAYREMGNFNESLFDLNRAIELMYARDIPKHYYLNRGRVYSLLNNYEAAILDFDKAIMVDPSYKEAFASRGKMYEILAQESEDNNIANKYTEKAREDFVISEQLEVRDDAEDDYLLFSFTVSR